MLVLALLIAAFICFVLSALNAQSPKVNLTGLGLALVTAALGVQAYP